MIPNDFHFTHPYLIVLLFAIPVFFILYGILFRIQKKGVEKFGNKEILDAIVLPRSFALAQGKVLFLLLGWIFLVFALMGPEGNAHYAMAKGIEGKRRAQEIVFLVDVSDSMSVKDSRTGQSRLGHAKELIDDMASLLQGENASLYAFTSILQQVSPATLDMLFIRLMAQNLHVNEGGVPGTDYANVMRTLSEKLKGESKQVVRTIVLISDGGDTKWVSLQGAEKDLREKEIVEAFSEPGVRVLAIGVGGNKEQVIPHVEERGNVVYSKLEPVLLQKISEATKGNYFTANDSITIDLARKVVDNIQSKEAVSMAMVKGQSIVFELYFQYPLFLSLLFLGIASVLPETKLRRQQ